MPISPFVSSKIWALEGRRLTSFSFLTSLVLVVLWCDPAGSQPAKKRVESVSDLPTFEYPVSAQDAGDLLVSTTAFARLAAAVRKDREHLLEQWDIRDRATLKQIHTDLLNLDMIEGRFPEASREIILVRNLEDNPSSKAFAGLFEEAYIRAYSRAGRDPAKLHSAFGESYLALLNDLDWGLMQNIVKFWKGRIEASSKSFFQGFAQHDLNPELQKSHTITSTGASELISFREAVQLPLPVQDDYLAACTQYIAAHKVARPEIWKARSIELNASERATPVRIGIWDSGVDLPMFRSYAENANKPDFEAWNFDGTRSNGYLVPLNPKQRAAYPQSKSLLKGTGDLTADIDSAEARQVKQFVSQANAAQAVEFWETLKLMSNYAHGTHVAGIAVEGNPFARLTLARIEFEWHTQPRLETVELARSWAPEYVDAVHFFQSRKVRVVNMSWGGTPTSIEENLAKNGVGKNGDERKQLALERFNIERDGMYEAMRSAPEILFVCAAMNNASDSTFTKGMPSSFELPNVLVVGAVDSAGDEASFTNSGPTVKVFANGYNVLSTIPGNDRMIMSGTSMASPQVTNVAAKLLTLDPSLTTSDLVQLIIAGTTTERPGRALLNPKRTVELLRARQKISGKN